MACCLIFPSMRATFQTLGAILLVSLTSAPVGVVTAEEPPLFSVRFTEKGVSFSGSVPSEEAGQAIAQAVNAVRPDLAIRNDGLKINSEVVLPATGELKGLLAELGISTHEGGFAWWDDAVLLTGMTDSRVTLTALRVRLDPLIGSRRLISRICIVPSEDLPNISVQLSNGLTGGALLDFDHYPTASEAFEMPGIRLEKIYPTLAMVSNLAQLQDGAIEEGSSEPIRAIPLLSSEPSEETGESGAAAAPLMRAIPAGPVHTRVELEPVRFSRNSFLLQANQKPVIEETMKRLQSPPLAGNRILVKPRVYRGAASAFGQYLSEKRAAEVRSLLLENGIPAGQLTIQAEDVEASVDEGIVRLVVEIPPPPDPPEEQGESEEENGDDAESPTTPVAETSPPADAPPSDSPEAESPAPE